MLQPYSKFITRRRDISFGKRVVPMETTLKDISMFNLRQGESISLFVSKNRKYAALTMRGYIHPSIVNDRLNSITAYLKALHGKRVG